jgi:hypothetical protein
METNSPLLPSMILTPRIANAPLMFTDAVPLMLSPGRMDWMRTSNWSGVFSLFPAPDGACCSVVSARLWAVFAFGIMILLVKI